MTTEVRLLRIGEVCRRVSISKPQIYKLMQRAEFPKPIQLSTQGRAWRSDEIEEWIEARTRQRDRAAPAAA